jgi:hypothetical protein
MMRSQNDPERLPDGRLSDAGLRAMLKRGRARRKQEDFSHPVGLNLYRCFHVAVDVVVFVVGLSALLVFLLFVLQHDWSGSPDKRPSDSNPAPGPIIDTPKSSPPLPEEPVAKDSRFILISQLATSRPRVQRAPPSHSTACCQHRGQRAPEERGVHFELSLRRYAASHP